MYISQAYLFLISIELYKIELLIKFQAFVNEIIFSIISSDCRSLYNNINKKNNNWIKHPLISYFFYGYDKKYQKISTINFCISKSIVFDFFVLTKSTG